MGYSLFKSWQFWGKVYIHFFPKIPKPARLQDVCCIRIFIVTTIRQKPNTKIFNNSPPFFSYGNQKWFKILFWRYLKVFILRIFWANNKRFHEFFWLAEESQLNLHPRHCQKTKRKETRKIWRMKGWKNRTLVKRPLLKFLYRTKTFNLTLTNIKT